jgi:hypothetical protein
MSITNNDDHRDDPDHDAGSLGGSSLVAVRRLLVRSIRVPFEPQEDFTTALDDLLETAAKGRGLPMPGVRLLSPSYSGKSTVAREYAASVLAAGNHPVGTMPVVYVKLDSEGSVSSLGTDLLRAMRKPRPDSLTPAKRWDRVRRTLRELGVLLIIFDEFQRAGRRPTMHPVIAGKIMDLMEEEEWSCACAFVGKTDAKAIFKATSDLGNRLDSPVQMGRLLWADDRHKKLFTEFADAFDQALVDKGVIVAKAGLGSEDFAELLLESSSGMIGQFCRIVETAVMAISRQGHTGITRDDLELAVDEWAIGNDRIGYNPFSQVKA